MIAVVVITLIVCALTANFVVERLSDRALRLSAAEVPPASIHTDRNHLWVWPEPSGVARIGVDQVAATLFGQPERIEWPALGRVERGAPLAVVHAHGRRLTLPSPIAGTIVEQNPLLAASPAAMADRPFDGGWLVRVAPTNLAAQLKHMQSGERLRAWSRQEMDRLRELVLSRLPAAAVLGVTAADGGPLGPGVAAQLDETAFREVAGLLFDADLTNPEPTLAVRQSECA